MKLELKHVIKAFEHGQKVKYFDNERCEWKICEIVELRIDECTISDGLIDYEVDFTEIKPILRPLSDLTKDDKFSELINEELICGAWKFVHDDWTTSIQTSNNQHTLLIIQNEVAPECTVLFFNYMIENHYDVFGLIEQGLAIDINTL